MNKNCPNCGAPVDPESHKCAYCGTIYFDMSMIDFDNHIPFFLTIKTQGYIITQLVQPIAGSIETHFDETNITGGINNTKLISVITNRQIQTDLSFNALPWDKSYIKTKKE